MPRVIIIPARIASRRLPGKLLLDQTGWPLIRHVYQLCQSVPGVSRVVVAADGPQMSSAVRNFGGEVVETNPDLASGTDRVAEACVQLDLSDDSRVVNVQGDEPELDPEHVIKLFELLESCENCSVATLATRHRDPNSEEQFRNPNRVKVILDDFGRARLFSRQAIPHCERGRIPQGGWLQHIGIYGFSPSSLGKFTQLPIGELESQERLEQLRWLEFGHEIAVGEVSGAAPGIDTEEDYQRFVENTLRMREDAGS